jgi:hypothetical protein
LDAVRRLIERVVLIPVLDAKGVEIELVGETRRWFVSVWPMGARLRGRLPPPVTICSKVR